MAIAQVETYICCFNLKKSKSNIMTECTESHGHISATPLIQHSPAHLVDW